MIYYILTDYYIKKSNTKDQTGEQRGGKYVARVQIGIEKDGSPRYRYFTSQDEYESYIQGRKGRSKKEKAEQKKRGKELSSKTKEERKQHKKKEEQSTKPGLLISGSKKKKKNSKKDDKSSKDAKVSKSFKLYVGV